MECHGCRQGKLSCEFPHEDLSADCKHPAFYCLRCMLAHAASQAQSAEKKCPLGCTLSSKTLAGLHEAFASMYPSSSLPRDDNEAQLPMNTSSSGASLRVVMLSGEEFTIAYHSDMLVANLKAELFKLTKVSPEKQKLLFKGEELVRAKLSEHHVQPGSTIHLLVILYEFKGNLKTKDVIFDLNWHFPSSGTDYLDGSCLFYNGTTRIDVVDYSHRKATGAQHSGDVMQKDSGHHDINISLAQIPPSVNRLFFTLSAYNCGDISRFRTPSVKLFYKDNPSEQLTGYSISSAGHASAVIMCCLQRVKDGWHVWTLGRHSSGTVRDYTQMDKTCKELIQSGLLPSA